MAGARVLLAELTGSLERAAEALSEVLARSPHLWNLDPLFGVRAMCLRKYGRMYCYSISYLDLDTAPYRDFLGALEELDKAGIPASTFRSGGILIIKWRPLEEAERLAEGIARRLADSLDEPVDVGAGILGVSDERGHLGYYVKVGTCIPGDWELDGLFARYTLLLRELEREGVLPLGGGGESLGVGRAEYCECAPILHFINREIRCAHVVVAGRELEPPRLPRVEEPSTYMPIYDEDAERLYPADVDGEDEVALHVFLPEYEPPWPCPRPGRVAERLGWRVLYSHEGRKSLAVAEVGGAIVELRCGPTLRHARLRLLQGPREGLVKAAKSLALEWARSALRLPPGHPYIAAVKRAGRLSELAEASRDYED